MCWYALTTQRWSLTSTTKEVAPPVSWLCALYGQSIFVPLCRVCPQSSFCQATACGEGWTNCWYAMVPLREVLLLPNRPSVVGLWMTLTLPMSPLISPRRWESRLTLLEVWWPSKAFLAGVPIQDICNAAGWSTPLSFVRFYGLDMRATPGSSVLSSHVTLVPWGNETLHLEAILPASLLALASFLEADAGFTARALYQLAITSPRPWCLAHPLDRLHLYSEPVTLKAFT